jgi:anthranilate synthase/aminodeoxychorismate synthase-like glutamine amidotransferase
MILLIDNYDSFTYNLAQLLEGLGAEVLVQRNDETTLDHIARLGPDGMVVSPGPGRPEDAGISVALIRRFAGAVPILGVCLGHQAIGAAYGARVVRARRPVHGKVSPVEHRSTGPFRHLPARVEMTRYHSLVLAPDGLPDELEVIAWTAEPGEEAEIQGIRHRQYPVWGVQFHPESVASLHGARLVANFLELTS